MIFIVISHRGRKNPVIFASECCRRNQQSFRFCFTPSVLWHCSLGDRPVKIAWLSNPRIFSFGGLSGPALTRSDLRKNGSVNKKKTESHPVSLFRSICPLTSAKWCSYHLRRVLHNLCPSCSHLSQMISWSQGWLRRPRMFCELNTVVDVICTDVRAERASPSWKISSNNCASSWPSWKRTNPSCRSSCGTFPSSTKRWVLHDLVSVTFLRVNDWTVWTVYDSGLCCPHEKMMLC